MDIEEDADIPVIFGVVFPRGRGLERGKRRGFVVPHVLHEGREILPRFSM